MKARIFLQRGKNKQLLAEVENLEVVPRGKYMVDGEEYHYSGTPTFIIEKGQLTAVEFTVEKFSSDPDLC